jgi:hypothetical protein
LRVGKYGSETVVRLRHAREQTFSRPGR